VTQQPGPSRPQPLLAVLARGVLGLTVMLVAVLALGTVPAAAHAALSSTTPAQGSQLSTAPADVTLVFTEEVGLSPRSVQVADARGRRVDDGRPQHAGGDSRTVQVALTPGLGQGSYTVTWRVVSVDGHPVSGSFAFGVGVPAGAVESASSVDPLVGSLRTGTQLLSYVGAVLLIGGSVFLFLLWPQGHADRGQRRVMVGGVIVAAVGAVGSLLVQGPYVAGRSLDGLVDAGLLGETLNSSYGRPMLLRVLAVALAVPVLGIWPRLSEADDAGPGGVAAAGNAVLLAASFSLTGHAAEASPKLLAEAADGVHLAAAGIWLGGLVVMLLAYLPSGPAPSEADDLLARWSRVAMASVGLLVVTGAYQAWRETRALDALAGTTYGRLLLGKLAVVVVLLAVAVTARRLVGRWSSVSPAPALVGAGPRPSHPPAGLPPPTFGRLRALVGVEALLGVAVLVVTSFLVATPPARASYGPPFSASVAGRDAEGTAIRVVLDVTPTKVGPATIRLRAFTPIGAPLPFGSATGELRPATSSPTEDPGPVRMQFSPAETGEGVATGVVVPSSGRWTLTVQIVTEGTTNYAARTTYTVR
jgi:copper transport protein